MLYLLHNQHFESNNDIFFIEIIDRLCMHVCVEVAMKKIFDPVTDSLEDFLNDEVEQNLRAEGELAIADFIRAKLNAQKLFQHQALVEGWIYAEHAHNDTDKVGQWPQFHETIQL